MSNWRNSGTPKTDRLVQFLLRVDLLSNVTCGLPRIVHMQQAILPKNSIPMLDNPRACPVYQAY
jgi:hypothetical protein